MTDVSAIIPKWYENTCDLILTIYFQAWHGHDFSNKPCPCHKASASELDVASCLEYWKCGVATDIQGPKQQHITYA